MNTRSLLLLSALLSLFAACGTKKPEKQDPPTVTSVAADITADSVIYESVMLPDASDTAIFKLAYTFYPNPSLPYQDSINALVKDFVLLSTHFERPDDADKEVLNHAFFQKHLKVFKASASEAVKDEFSVGIWDFDASIGIDHTLPGYEQLSFSIYTYTGGAHGNGYVRYDLISKANGRTLKLQDIATDTNALTRVAERYFREERELADTANLETEGYWFENNTFACNDNFYFSENALIFFYNSYEIGPYAFGPTEIEIPLNEIAMFLKPEFTAKKD